MRYFMEGMQQHQISAKNYRIHLPTAASPTALCAEQFSFTLPLYICVSQSLFTSVCVYVTILAVQTQRAGLFLYLHIFHNFSCPEARGRPNILHHKSSPRPQPGEYVAQETIHSHTCTHTRTQTVCGLENLGSS